MARRRIKNYYTPYNLIKFAFEYEQQLKFRQKCNEGNCFFSLPFRWLLSTNLWEVEGSGRRARGQGKGSHKQAIRQSVARASIAIRLSCCWLCNCYGCHLAACNYVFATSCCHSHSLWKTCYLDFIVKNHDGNSIKFNWTVESAAAAAAGSQL